MPLLLNGVVINAHGDEFSTDAGGIPFQADLKAANVKLVRRQAFPNPRFPTHKDGSPRDVAWFDRQFQAVLKAGATPLFIQPTKNYTGYVKEDGSPGGTIEANLVFNVRHFLGARFNLKQQIWEVGNEPNNPVDQVFTPPDYAALFNRCHEALVKAGLRENVTLCGPVLAYHYNWPRNNRAGDDPYFDYFIEHCAAGVDVVTYHTYAGAKDEAGVLQAPHKLDFLEDFARTFPIDPKDGKPKDVYGTAALLAKMKTIKFGRPNVGIGMTELNTQRDSISRTLWCLAVSRYHALNPLSRFTTQFVFADYGTQQGGFGAYDAQKKKSFGYWALWMAGNLRGNQVIEAKTTGNTMKDGRPLLLVLATRDAQSLFIEVINRGTEAVKDHVVIDGAQIGNGASIHQITATQTPELAAAAKLSVPFDYEFPALSATVFKFPLRK